MYNLKGFIEITALANNIPTITSPLGELSNVSASYAIEKGYYNKSDADNVKLVSFTSAEDDTKKEVPAVYHSHILDIAQWAFGKAIAGKLTSNAETFRTLMLAQYDTSMEDVEVGDMVSSDGRWLPSYIKWTLIGQSDNEIRIWFADDAFKAQYDDFEIVVVPPIEPVDVFQEVIAVVSEALGGFNYAVHLESVYDKTDGEPYTNAVSKEYDWYDREDDETTLPTNWTVAIYGVAGNNPLLIKAAIAKYILSNSSFSIDYWTKVFPDIFTSTEYVIVPMWHRRSVPDETIYGELYSPIVAYDETLTLAEKYIKYATTGHVKNNLEYAVVHYKSLAFLSVGGDENRDDVFKLSDWFKDYALIASSSADFNRMATRTTDFIIKLQAAVIAAETIDDYTYLDVSLARIERDGFTYVGFSYEDVLYLILSRNSMSEVTA